MVVFFIVQVVFHFKVLYLTCGDFDDLAFLRIIGLKYLNLRRKVFIGIPIFFFSFLWFVINRKKRMNSNQVSGRKHYTAL